MNGHLNRANAFIVDGWPILVACAIYLAAFGIFAMTSASGIPVA